MDALRLSFFGFVQAGFPSPASDYSEESIDLKKELIRYEPSTFFVRANNDSMIEAHIPPQSILIVDKALTPKNYSIVVASIDGDFLVKYYVREGAKVMLLPANKKYKPIVITEGMKFQVWGVVTNVIIQVLKYPV